MGARPTKMPHDEDMHYQASFDSIAPPRFSSNILKAGAALLSGACLGFLAVHLPKLQSSSSAEFTSLVGGPTSFRQSPMTSLAGRRAALAALPGGSWKDVALAAMEASNGCHRDISMKANPQLKAAVENMDSKSKAELMRLSETVHAAAKKKLAAAADGNEYGLPGAIAPLNFWDPLSLSADVDKAKLLYYREAEIKHGRICMSGSLGFLVAERYHPLFGGDVDVPSVYAPLETNLRTFWAALAIVVGFTEAYTSGWFTTKRNAGERTLAEGLEPGDLGYDPLGLLPTDPEELEEIQNKEILNGRFAMISLAGMVAEELITKEKLHGLDFFLGPS